LVYVTQWNGGAFGTVDVATGNFTNIAQMPIGTEHTIFMAIDNDGVAYGIKNTTSTFGTINLATAEFTPITTGLSFTPAQIQNLGVDRETNELYWIAHTNTADNSTVYKINKTTGALTQVATISTRVESFAIITSPPDPCDAISDLTHSVSGSNVTLDWTAAPGSPTGYKISYDGATLTTVTTTTYTHTNVPDGSHLYGVTALYAETCLPFGVFQTVIVGEYCTFRIEMEDSEGDGWGDPENPNAEFSSIRIYYQGNLIAECTVPYDSYSATAYPLLPVGEIQFAWHEGNNGNNYDWECSFRIYNSQNELIHQILPGGASSGVFKTYDNDCGGIFPLVTRYNVYRGDELIAENISATTFTDNKLDPKEGHTWSVKVICEEGESELIEASLPACESSINDLLKTEFSIVPNPAKNDITISAGIIINTVEVINFLGQTIISQFVGTTNTVQLDVSNLTNGVYFVRIAFENGNSVKKFVKQ